MKLAKLRAVARPMAVALPHWLTLTLVALVTAFGVAVEQYLQTVPMATWISGLTNPKTLIPVATSALIAGAAAFIGQLLLLFKQWAATVEQPPGVVVVAQPPPPSSVQT